MIPRHTTKLKQALEVEEILKHVLSSIQNNQLKHKIMCMFRLLHFNLFGYDHAIIEDRRILCLMMISKREWVMGQASEEQKLERSFEWDWVCPQLKSRDCSLLAREHLKAQESPVQFPGRTPVYFFFCH